MIETPTMDDISLSLCFLERVAATRFAAVRKGGCQLVQDIGEHFVFVGLPWHAEGVSDLQSVAAARLCTGYRGIGRLFGNGICPVIGGSSEARVFGALLRIASAACWNAAAAFSSSLVR